MFEDIFNYNATEKKEPTTNKVFIVHGHDQDSKIKLENILYKWGITPYAIQDEDSKGKTIIEFLENEIQKTFNCHCSSYWG